MAQATRPLTRLLGNGPGGAGPFPQMALYRLPSAETQPQILPHEHGHIVGLAKGGHYTLLSGADAPANEAPGLRIGW